MWAYFWALYSVPLIYVSVFVQYYFDDCSFVVQFKVKECDTFSFCFVFFFCFSPRSLWIFEIFCVSIYILGLFVLVQGKTGHFDRDWIKSSYCFVYYGHFNNINLSSQWMLAIFKLYLLFLCTIFNFLHYCFIFFSV